MRHARMLWAGMVAAWAFLLCPTSPTHLPSSAEASVSVALTLEELVDASHRAVVGEVLEQRSQWEHVQGSRRIVTYSKLEVRQTVYGPAQATVWVRTLGGAVGRIGQYVSGEAQLRPHEPCVLFLTETPDGALCVTGRAQGHYPVQLDEKGAARLRPSPDRGRVIRRRGGSAAEVLVGKTLPAALRAIREARKR